LRHRRPGALGLDFGKTIEFAITEKFADAALVVVRVVNAESCLIVDDPTLVFVLVKPMRR